jgi:hypothetical protein
MELSVKSPFGGGDAKKLLYNRLIKKALFLKNGASRQQPVAFGATLLYCRFSRFTRSCSIINTV